MFEVLERRVSSPISIYLLENKNERVCVCRTDHLLGQRWQTTVSKKVESREKIKRWYVPVRRHLKTCALVVQLSVEVVCACYACPSVLPLTYLHTTGLNQPRRR